MENPSVLAYLTSFESNIVFVSLPIFHMFDITDGFPHSSNGEY